MWKHFWTLYSIFVYVIWWLWWWWRCFDILNSFPQSYYNTSDKIIIHCAYTSKIQRHSICKGGPRALLTLFTLRTIWCFNVLTIFYASTRQLWSVIFLCSSYISGTEGVSFLHSTCHSSRSQQNDRAVNTPQFWYYVAYRSRRARRFFSLSLAFRQYWSEEGPFYRKSYNNV